MNAPLILASSSPYRKALLERLALDIRCIVANIDETPQADEPPTALVCRLARQKAEAVAQTVAASQPPALIIGADQVAVAAGEILTKPGDKATAIKQLQTQSGRAVIFYTGVCLLNAASGQADVDMVPAEVRFRSLSLAEIERYVDREQPWDCAGSFKSEGHGITLVEAIETTDNTALIGLPLLKTAALLRVQGYNIP